MEKSKIVSVNKEYLLFDTGYKLESDHDQGCCESHYLDFDGVSDQPYEDLEFDLSNDKFFNRVEGFGIELIPVSGSPLRIAGYGDNNGYYSSNLDLLLTHEENKVKKIYDITDCQDY